MLLGAHESVAEGYHLALDRGMAHGCEAIQIFTGFNTRWAGPEITDETASTFRSEAALRGVPLLSHACYLINLASPDADLYEKSIAALVEELERCELLGVPFAVLHPGAHMGTGERQGIARAAKALDQVHARTSGFTARVVLENTAGQGTCLGHQMEHLGDLMGQTRDGQRLAVCLDTCHLFAAGYDFRSQEAYTELQTTIRRVLGVDRIVALHVNDSKTDCRSRCDRHARIGEGRIGLEGFRHWVNDSAYADCPAVLELPPADVATSLARLKSLRG